MKILKEILATLPEGEILEVRVGLHWTAVVVAVDGVRRCGLAATLRAEHDYHGGGPDVPQAGQLQAFSGRQLAELALETHPTRVSLGVAAINALLPHSSPTWSDENAEAVVARRGASQRVALIGHFPFVPTLRPLVQELWILEQNPGPEDLPAHLAPEILPQADVVAITGMTLVNDTLEGLLALCSPQAYVLLLGPSTPLSPVLFAHGVHALSGTVVTDPEAVLRVITQAGSYRQVHRAGTRLVNMYRPADFPG